MQSNNLVKQNIVTLSALLIIFVITYNFFDQDLAIFFHNHSTNIFSYINQYITQLGKGSSVAIMLYILLIFALMRNNLSLAYKLIYVTLVCVICGIANDILKIIFARARPVELFTHGIYGFQFLRLNSHFASFPSGHTTMITAMCYGLTKIWSEYKKSLIFAAIIISFSRVVVCAHYLSDVMVAFGLSLLLVDIMNFYLKPKFVLLIPKTAILNI